MGEALLKLLDQCRGWERFAEAFRDDQKDKGKSLGGFPSE
jgi:hypothetical protein